MNNITLIGMPGVGKSTIGIVLAKVIGYSFIDTDILIQQTENKLLQEIIDEKGIQEFLAIEEQIITSHQWEHTVIATGGSAVLSKKAMDYLYNQSIVVYLSLSQPSLLNRINNMESRGIVKSKDQSLEDIFKIRCPLYEQYSDITIDCEKKDFEEIIKNIVEGISCRGNDRKKRCVAVDA